MRAFLCGGGDGNQVEEAYRTLNRLIDHSKPLLYIPLAMSYEQYNDCYKWIQQELKCTDIEQIDMVTTSRELYNKNLEDYCAIFFGGGNTFKLLFELKLSGCFEKVKEYINNNGIIFGGSAGAVVMGNDIKACEYNDNNLVGLVNTKGFDLLNGISLICHYTSIPAEEFENNKNFLLKLSANEKIIALPEEDTIFINDDKIDIIGNEPYYIFEDKKIVKIDNRKLD